MSYTLTRFYQVVVYCFISPVQTLYSSEYRNIVAIREKNLPTENAYERQ